MLCLMLVAGEYSIDGEYNCRYSNQQIFSFITSNVMGKSIF